MRIFGQPNGDYLTEDLSLINPDFYDSDLKKELYDIMGKENSSHYYDKRKDGAYCVSDIYAVVECTKSKRGIPLTKRRTNVRHRY